MCIVIKILKKILTYGELPSPEALDIALQAFLKDKTQENEEYLLAILNRVRITQWYNEFSRGYRQRHKDLINLKRRMDDV